MKPHSLNDLIAQLNVLPGITKKQAERLAYHLVTGYKEEGNELASKIETAQKKIVNCEICGFITDDKICYICKNTEKDRRKILVVVESSLDVFKFEKSDSINPFYHVLNGLVDVSKNKGLEKLNTQNLKKRSNDFKEIILALSPNLEGIVTANLIKNLLKGIKVTQLAQGIPLGAAMEYVDEMTLKIALDNRKEMK